MNLSFLKLKSPYAAVIVVTALFLYTIFLGMSQGKVLAMAKSNLLMAQELNKGLDYFFKDQGRFPDAEEFADKSILFSYFSALPETVSLSPSCEQNFVYKRLNDSGYELDFCLAASLDQYSKGWNKSIVQK